MRDYKGYSAEQRRKNLVNVKELIANGELESPYKKKCEICGQDKGIREYHCTDYNPEVALKSLKCLCYKCHRYLHVFELGESHKYYQNAKKYFEKVKTGYIYKPLYDYKKFNWHYENLNFGETDETR